MKLDTCSDVFTGQIWRQRIAQTYQPALLNTWQIIFDANVFAEALPIFERTVTEVAIKFIDNFAHFLLLRDLGCSSLCEFF